MRLLSGATVYEGPHPHSLAELRDKVAATMGCERKDELVFCSGDAVLDCIEDAGDEITAVRSQVMGLLPELLKYASYGEYGELPEHLWHAREHRGLLLAAVAVSGYALRHASPELRADRDVVLAAVTTTGYALQYASPELRADRDVVLAAVERCCLALTHASEELRADRDVVLAAVEAGRHVKPASHRNEAGRWMQYAYDNLVDCSVVMAAVANDRHVLVHASAELRAERKP